MLYIISNLGGAEDTRRRGQRAHLCWLPRGHLPIEQDPWRPGVSPCPPRLRRPGLQHNLTPSSGECPETLHQDDDCQRQQEESRRTGSPINLILKTFVKKKKKKPQPTESIYMPWTVPNEKKRTEILCDA